jgi:hypothetical protein
MNMDVSMDPERPHATNVSGALALVCMPFTFIQDDLLDTKGFLSLARERGHDIDAEDIQDLQNRRLLIPLYRVSDTSVAGRRLDVVPNGNMDYRREALQAASEGRLRDSAEEGSSMAWPHLSPSGEANPRWWNGFLYSSWQVVDLNRALVERSLLRRIQQRVRHSVPPRELWRRRNQILALAALTPRYLPGILGQLSLPSALDRQALEGFRFYPDVLGLLNAAGYDPSQLRDDAEHLLLETHRDPLRDWLPLLRYASYDAWKKLHGEALDCLWLRIAAEVLLRAHEDLAAEGLVEALPDSSSAMYVRALNGRLGRKNDGPRPLEQVLGNFGISPHPRVLVVIEGKTERLHVRPLLEQFGLGRPEQVRLQQCAGSKVNPQLLARYAITPRLGKKYGDAWELAATPTALVIAMDPENKWATPDMCEEQRTKIKQAVREEVELQGGQIDEATLDFNVNVFTWGKDKYELANFTNEELLPALAQLAKGPGVGTDAWIKDVTQKLDAARQSHEDIKVVTGPLRVDKVPLAKLLWPVLLAKCERELETGNVETPILKVMLRVEELVIRLSAGGYVLPPSK